jgi:methionyl-tRNA synthetase
MRGIESRGMLLAADYVDSEGKECVEVLDCPWAPAGTPVVLEGAEVTNEHKTPQIDADTFFAVDIIVKDKSVYVGDKLLIAAGKPVVTQKTINGEVH